MIWNLRLEGPRLVALRTTPEENPHIWDEPRFDKAETRPVMHWGIEQSGLGPIAAPGKYTVRLTVDGQSYTQPIEILLPPDSHGSEADIQASVRLQTRVRDNLSAVSDMSNQIEWMRKKLEDDHRKVAGQSELLRRVQAIDQKLQEVEYKLISRNDALSDDKYFISQFKLYMNFMWLEGEIGSGLGDVAGSGDYGPTETALSLVLGLERELAIRSGRVQKRHGKRRSRLQQIDRRHWINNASDNGRASPANRRHATYGSVTNSYTSLQALTSPRGASTSKQAEVERNAKKIWNSGFGAGFGFGDRSAHCDFSG